MSRELVQLKLVSIKLSRKCDYQLSSFCNQYPFTTITSLLFVIYIYFFFFLKKKFIVSLPRNNRCREYHFETLQFGNINRWPKNNDLLTVEGDRCLMSSSKSGLFRIK